MLMAFRPELGAADPATSAAMVAGAVIGASCGAQAGFAKSALTTLGGAVAGHFAMAATGDPLVTLAAAAGGALVGYALAS